MHTGITTITATGTHTQGEIEEASEWYSRTEAEEKEEWNDMVRGEISAQESRQAQVLDLAMEREEAARLAAQARLDDFDKKAAAKRKEQQRANRALAEKHLAEMEKTERKPSE